MNSQSNPLDLLFSLNSSLQQLDTDRFFKLSTEIEIIEINKLKLIEMVNQDLAHQPILLGHLTYWMIHKSEKYFTIVKLQDNSQGANIFQEQLLNSLLDHQGHLESNILELNLIMDIILSFFEHDPFMISSGQTPIKNQLSLVYNDPLKLGNFISQSFHYNINQDESYLSNIFCIIPSLVKTSGKMNPVNLCKLQNAFNISNSISLKHIKYSDTKQLLSLSKQNIVLERISSRVLSINQLLLWDDAEDLETLLQTLQESKTYCPEEQEFMTQVDYFSNPSPNDRSSIIMSLLDGDKIQFLHKLKEDLQLDVFISYSGIYKEQSIYITFNGVQVLDENKRKPIQQFMSKLYKKSYISIITISSQNPKYIDMKEVLIFLDEHQDEIKRPRCKQRGQVNIDSKMISIGAKLMLSIEEKLKDSINELKPKQKERIANNLQRLFVKFFFIDNA